MEDYFDLGSYSRPITTSSPDAQLWFDRGLNWCYGFAHEESVRCFQKALEFDPECAMAYWGIAYASGPNYNREWHMFEPGLLIQVVADTYAATQTAIEKMAGCTEPEQALIQALGQRYQSASVVSEDKFTRWNDAYADAMRDVHAKFPTDLDLIALTAEALVNRTPWRLWDLRTGLATPDSDTMEAIDVLETGQKFVDTHNLDPHPGILHIYIHVMEMSPHPERALRASDDLRDLVPDAGHLQHMPSHIDILCGHYYNAVVANSKAIVVDQKYVERVGAFNYYAGYRGHNYHFKLFAAMFLGQYKPALDAANALIDNTPEKLLRIEEPAMADRMESAISMKMHVLVRFGKWQEILAESLPTDQTLYCVTTTMLHYAKAIAHAATGNVQAAEAEKVRFDAAYKTVPETRRIHNNSCIDVLAIASAMLNGEIEYRKGNYDHAFASLRQAVDLDDNLLYDEPWAWMQPARHALGALLLEQGRVAEAEAVYRADLGLDDKLSRASQHPENVWALHGYVECLEKLDKADEATAMRMRLDLAKARADVPIEASCFCRLEKCC